MSPWLAASGGDHKANEDVNNNEEEHWMRCGGVLSLSSAMFMSISIRGTVARSQQHYTLELSTGLRDIDISQIPKKATSRAFSFSLFEASY